jgi:hypothetical protein
VLVYLGIIETLDDRQMVFRNPVYYL